MKELLVESLINPKYPDNLKYVEKIKYIAYLLKQLSINGDVVALVTTNKELQSYFQLACLLRGINYVILNSNEVDEHILSSLEVKVLLLDRKLYPAVPEYLYENTFIRIIVNASTLLIESMHPSMNSEQYLNHKFSINNNLTNAFRNFSVSDKDYSIVRRDFESICVKYDRESTIFVVHPANSSYGEKISVFKAEALFHGLLQIMDTLGKDLSNYSITDVKHNAYTIENVAYPYVFLLSVLLPIFKGGHFYLNNRIDFKSVPLKYVLLSSQTAVSTLMDQVDDNRWLSLFYGKEFNIIFRFLFKMFFKRQFNVLPIFIIYGKIDKRLQTLLKYLKVKVFYMYSMIEVSSFISYKYYDRIPSSNKQLTVGKLPHSVVLNGKDINGNSELLISLQTQFSAYTNMEFTALCTMSEKYLGMHSTLDIISEEKDGEAVVRGKAEEMFINQNGLAIQNSLIYSMVLNNPFVGDALIIVLDNSIIVLVELRISTLLLKNTSAEKVMLSLNTELLPRINSKVAPYSMVSKIIMVPGNFVRSADGKIKLSRYILDSRAE